MERKMSLFNRRIAAKIKNGSDTKVAVDARGSACFRLKYNAIHIINKEITIDIEALNNMGTVLSSESSLFIFENIISRETAEKHNR